MEDKGYEAHEYFTQRHEAVAKRKTIKGRTSSKYRDYDEIPDTCKAWQEDDYKGEFSKPVRFNLKRFD